MPAQKSASSGFQTSLEAAVLQWRKLDPQKDSKLWAKGAEAVAREFTRWLFGHRQVRIRRYDLESCDLVQSCLLDCWPLLSRWDPGKAHLEAFLGKPILGAIRTQERLLSRAVCLPAGFAKREADGSSKEIARHLWTQGRLKDEPNSEGEGIMERLPGPDGRWIDRKIDRDRFRAAFRAAMVTKRESGLQARWNRGVGLFKAHHVRGQTTREIGEREGVSHVRVLQILHETSAILAKRLQHRGFGPDALGPG